eukprot:1307886-Alexandrium_andersonii.AAC.1
MLQAVERTGGGLNGNLYQRPSNSPCPELEMWREVVDMGSAQAIGLSEISMAAFGPQWVEQVHARRNKRRLRDQAGFKAPRGSPPLTVPPPVARTSNQEEMR